MNRGFCERNAVDVSFPSSLAVAPISLRAMDWTNWQPREYAVLCFVVKEGRILLIHKKRGLGAGKVNGPGGRIEPGETPEEAAVREVQEEIGVTPLDLARRGVLRFEFTDGYSLHCIVFLARDFAGELIETAEAIPFWAAVDAVPYGKMWEDDRHWLPSVLAGLSFESWFVFEGDRMLEKRVEVILAEACE